MPRLMEKNDWMQTVADVRSALLPSVFQKGNFWAYE